MGSVLVLGDSHGNVPFIANAFKKVIDRADEIAGTTVDAVVSVGDFGIWPGKPGVAFLDHVEMQAAKRDLDVYVVPGNHDDYDQLADAPEDGDGWLVLRDHVRAAPRGHVFTLGGRTFLTCGGAASPDGPGGIFAQARGPVRGMKRVWDQAHQRVRFTEVDKDLGGWWPDEIVTDGDVAACLAAIDRLHAAGRPVDVLVTHDAPAEIALGGGDFPAGQQVRDKLQTVLEAARPSLAFAGHWHCGRVQQLAHGRDAWGIVLSADVNPNDPQWALVDLATLAPTLARPADPTQRL